MASLLMLALKETISLLEVSALVALAGQLEQRTTQITNK